MSATSGYKIKELNNLWQELSALVSFSRPNQTKFWFMFKKRNLKKKLCKKKDPDEERC